MTKYKQNGFKDYLYGLILGLIMGFFITNTYLSVRWRRRSVTCWTSLVVDSEKIHEAKSYQSQNLSLNHVRRSLLLCVLTTRNHLQTRALALFQTLSLEIGDDILFFIGGNTSYSGPLRVVMLENIADDEYPPRRKSFAMLEYVNSYYGDKYKWFMRVDDDMYIFVKKLREFLSRINENKLIYMGHPGTGSQSEQGQIGLHGDEPYCMGGPGVLFSKALFNAVGSRFRDCLNSTASKHEDTEIGRCIFKYYHLPCTRSKEFEALFYNNYEDMSGQWLESMDTARHLTVHPLKNHSYIYQAFIKDKSKTIWRLENKIGDMEREINRISTILNMTEPDKHRAQSYPSELLQILKTHVTWSCDFKLNYFSLRIKNFIEPSSYQGRTASFLAARKGLVHYVTDMNIPKPIKLAMISYRRLIPMRGLQYIFVTKDNKDTIRMFLTLQNFHRIQFTDTKIVHNKTWVSSVLRQ